MPTATATAAKRFKENPLEFLDQRFPNSAGIVQTGPHEFCLGDPLVARAVLQNRAGHYEPHSDFFHTRRGMFGPRAVQLRIRREAYSFLREYLSSSHRGTIVDHIKANLPQVTQWPNTGNRLIYRYLATALVTPSSPPNLRRVIDDLVERAVLVQPDDRSPTWLRVIARIRAVWTLLAAIKDRQAEQSNEPADLLDVVARALERGQRVEELLEVFLSFVFAMAGSLGFVLAWALYLFGTNPATDSEPEWVVREALRLGPVAWMLARRPAASHQVGGTPVDSADQVVVCPYLVHRNPNYWERPSAFVPRRWAAPESRRNPAFIPFGYGPHRCVAAELSMELVQEFFREITEANHVTVISHRSTPIVGAALAPPPFQLILTPK